MTTGSWGSLNQPVLPYTGIWSGKSWTGGDGKYELIHGSQRAKWNSYVSRLAVLRSRYPYWKWVCPKNSAHTLDSVSGIGFYNHGQVDSGVGAFTNAERNRLLSKLLEAVKGHSFNAAVNIAQSRQIADMVVSNLGSFGRSVRALKRGDFANAARQLGVSQRPSSLKTTDVSGRWLELIYGWGPTIKDTYEACKAYEAITNGPQRSRHSVGLRKRVPESVPTQVGQGTSWQLAQTRILNYTLELEEEIDAARQLGLADPLSVAWEVLPWSFVVDWFIPIGTYLSNLNQIPHLVGRWMVTDALLIGGVIPTWTAGSGGWCPFNVSHPRMVVSKMPDMDYTGIVTRRNALSSPPKVPLPTIKLEGAVHGRRIFNAIALAHQRFS